MAMKNMLGFADVSQHFVNEDNQEIFCKYWEPDTETRALAFIIHGLGEHVQKYEKVAKFLNGLGFKVCGHDHIGHGMSEGPRIDVHEYSHYSRDALRHVDIVKKQNPEMPIFLISHSTGCLVAIEMSNSRPDEFFNVMIAPCLMFHKEDAPKMKIFLETAKTAINPNLKLYRIDSKNISRDPAVNKDYDDDPLVYHDKFTNGYLLKLFNAMKRIEKTYSSITWPYILLYGTEDRLCDVSYSDKLFEESVSEDKTIKRYEGYSHQIQNEPEDYSKLVFDDITEWLTSRLEGNLYNRNGN